MKGCCHLFSTYAPAVVLPLRAPNTSSYGGSDLREDRHAVALIVITLDASTSAILLGQRIGRSHRTTDVCGTLETLPLATLDLRKDSHHRAELNKTSRRSATRTERGQVPHGFGNRLRMASPTTLVRESNPRDRSSRVCISALDRYCITAYRSWIGYSLA